MADETDQIKPWTIKGVSPEARNAAINAAARNQMSQGEWVGRAIITAIQVERNEPRGLVPEPPASTPNVVKDVAPPPAPVAPISERIDAAAKLAAATGKALPRSVARAFYKQLLGEDGRERDGTE